MKKMKNLFNPLILFFCLLLFLGNCTSVKDALSNQKKPGGDEFLVEKKNPLTMPPDFNALPKPGSLNEINKNKGSERNIFDLKKELSDKSNIKTTSTTKSNDTLEKSIIKKINKR